MAIDISKFDVRHDFEDIVVVKPSFRPDPYVEICEILEAPWAEEYGVQTIVLDTVTQYGDVFLAMAASEGRFTSNPIQFGRGKHIKTLPVEGDYRVAQSLCQDLADIAFDLPLDVCFIGHEGVMAKGKKGSPGYDLISAGMATAGQAQVDKYGGQFDQYIRLKYAKGKDKDRLVAQLVGDNTYQAKVRDDGTNPPAREISLSNARDPAEQLKGLQQFWIDRAKEGGIDLDDPARTGYLRVAEYGRIGTGKTRLALTMPRKRILYIAVDRNSEFLRSMLAAQKVPVEGS